MEHETTNTRTQLINTSNAFQKKRKGRGFSEKELISRVWQLVRYTCTSKWRPQKPLQLAWVTHLPLM